MQVGRGKEALLEDGMRRSLRSAGAFAVLQVPAEGHVWRRKMRIVLWLQRFRMQRLLKLPAVGVLQRQPAAEAVLPLRWLSSTMRQQDEEA